MAMLECGLQPAHQYHVHCLRRESIPRVSPGSWRGRVPRLPATIAGRSQMAAAFFNQLADPHKAQANSVGTEPGERIHPELQAVMQEIGINLSQAKPQKITEELARDVQLLISMGCGDKCPYVPSLRRDDLAPFKTRRDCPLRKSGRYAMK
jgi:Low molecular weight phosphotyrosine protein phosphatase